MNELLNELIVLLNKVFPSINTETVSMKSDLRTDLAIDSFHMMLLAISIEDHFGIKLDESFAPKNVEDVCRYLQERISMPENR